MKKLVNVYSYENETKIIESTDEFGNREYKSVRYVKDYLKAEHKKRSYKTRMTPNDLPENYCDVQRYGSSRELINAKGITDVKYTWIKENHFMKDSMLRISYTGKLEPYNEIYNYNGKEIISVFTSYKNHDWSIFDYDILKFLGYVKRFSDFDITEVKNEFIKHCEWLKENEPSFAPKTDDFGKWFDEKTSINM